jgi:DNA-nicking Smr family endonuclease
VAARRTGDDEHSAVERALKGVKPLAGRDARVPVKRARPAPPTRARDAAQDADDDASETERFAIVTSGERVEGLAPGIDRAWLRKLRSGDVRVDARVDLHGLSAREAKRTVRRALLDAHDAGDRCVLVVHGRGTHSPEGPVLRAFLLRWLTEARVAPIVMAFASARPADGGAGATYVLLRRKR